MNHDDVYDLQQLFGIDTRPALQDYVSASAAPGSLYSPSLQFNYALNSGDPLTPNRQYIPVLSGSSYYSRIEIGV